MKSGRLGMMMKLIPAANNATVVIIYFVKNYVM